MSNKNASSGGGNGSGNGGGSKPIRSVVGGSGNTSNSSSQQQQPHQQPTSSSIPIPSASAASQAAAARILNTAITTGSGGLISVGSRENLIRSAAKQQNRHTIAISNDSYENFASNLSSKLNSTNNATSNDDYSMTTTSNTRSKLKNIPQQSSFESSNNNSSPLSKTPDSTSNNENWITIAENSSSNSHQQTHQQQQQQQQLQPQQHHNYLQHPKGGSGGDLSSYVGVSSTSSSSTPLYHADSDHDMLDSSGGGGGGQGAAATQSDDDFDPVSTTSLSSPSTGARLGPSAAAAAAAAFDNYTNKRLHAFITTTLHFEHVYLAKLQRLLAFKLYLEEFYSGSQADVSVIFIGIAQIRATHETVARKLQDYLESLSDLLAGRSFAHESSLPMTNNTGSGGMITKLNQVVGSSRQATNLAPQAAQLHSQVQTSSNNTTSNEQSSSSQSSKESFLSKALQLLANIMEISFPVYHEFLQNYPKAMTILNKLEKTPSAASRSIHLLSKRKSFVDCQLDFNKSLRDDAAQKKSGFLSKITTSSSSSNKSASKDATASKDPFNIYYVDKRSSDEKFDIARMLSEDILRRPTKLFEFTCSLKDECMLASKELSPAFRAHLESNIKSLFENEGSKRLREKVFDEINRNIMPIEVRKSEDVVELIESNNDRKLRYLILYGDCLACCRLKKDKRQLKWFIRIDQLEIFLDNCKTAKSDVELRQLREEVASLRGNLKRQEEENASARNQLKIKKKLAEQENELTMQSSRLKLIVRENTSLSQQPTVHFHTSSSTSSASSSTATNMQNNNSSFASSSGGFFSSAMNNSLTNALSTSMNNLANLALSGGTSSSNSANNNSASKFTTANNSSGNNMAPNGGNPLNNNNSNALNGNVTQASTSSSFSFNHSSSNKFVFLFTSDFERNSWLEEINAAIYAYKTRNKPVDIHQSDLEARINSLKKIEEPPKVVTSSYTGSLELLVKHIEDLSEPNKVFVAVELKSCGSYLQVAQTRCTDLTSKPIWNEKFNLELQAVDSLRIILYSQTSGKALAIASQELRIDSNVNLNKINCAKLTNGMSLYISMKLLSPKKTITRRRTRNRNDIFGGNLADLLQREKSTIPRILKDCVEIIETRGIEEVGIYRVSSVVSEVHKMKELYCKNANLALSELRQKSAHLSANLLKLYLRELPDPLFTSFLYERFMGALECSLVEFRYAELCRVFNELPETNKTIIIFLLNHLLNIASRSDKNMMGLQNLCTLFGPTLMKLSPPKETLQVEDMNKEIKESMQQAQVLFYVLQLHAEDKLISSGSDSSPTRPPAPSSTITAAAESQHSSSSSSSSPSTKPTASTTSDRRRSLEDIIDNNNNNLHHYHHHPSANTTTTTSNRTNTSNSNNNASSSSSSTTNSSSNDRLTKLSMQTAL